MLHLKSMHVYRPEDSTLQTTQPWTNSFYQYFILSKAAASGFVALFWNNVPTVPFHAHEHFDARTCKPLDVLVVAGCLIASLLQLGRSCCCIPHRPPWMRINHIGQWLVLWSSVPEFDIEGRPLAFAAAVRKGAAAGWGVNNGWAKTDLRVAPSVS